MRQRTGYVIIKWGDHMRILKKILLIFLIVIIGLSALIGVIFSRPSIPRADLEDDYFTTDSSYVDVMVPSLDGDDLAINLHVMDMGEETDPVILLVHGAFSSSHTFLDWAKTLVLNGYRVIMPDLPYFGLSEGFDDKVSSFRRSALAIKAVLDQKQVTEVHIAGNSLGGAVSWFFASEFPEMTISLTLIDAVYPGLEQNGRETLSRFTRFDLIAKPLSTLTPRFLLRAMLKTAYGDPDLLSETVLTRYEEILRKEGTREAILQTTSEAEPTFSYLDRLESLAMPVFVIWGELDTWIDPITVEHFKETIGIPDERIIIYPDLGHVPMEEDPERTVLDYMDLIDNLV